MTNHLDFDYESSGFPVRRDITEAHRASWQAIARPGPRWSGVQRVEIARQARAARNSRGDPPWLRKGLPDTEGRIPEAACQAARTIAADAHRIDRDWATQAIETLGDAAYVELGSIVATVAALDAFAEALGRDQEPLPSAEAGTRADTASADGVADIGAYVPVVSPFSGPNVSRALSLVPEANRLFFTNVGAMYGGVEQSFYDLEWTGPISRPQAELLAARVSALNECFY